MRVISFSRHLAEFILAALVSIISVTINDFALLRGMYVGPMSSAASTLGIVFILSSITAITKVFTIVAVVAKGLAGRLSHKSRQTILPDQDRIVS